MIKRLYFELYKNFRIIFRSFTSISILILGPLLLILLLGFAFSGNGAHGIVIGIYSPQYAQMRQVLSDFPGIGEMREYGDIDNCLDDMKLEKVHICLKFGDSFMLSKNSSEPPSGEITFYYDNTRKQISTAVLNEISKYLGIKSDEISIEGTRTIFTNIETMTYFLSQRNTDILSVINESENIKVDLLARKEKLVQFRNDFNPRYERIKVLQSEINNLSGEANASHRDVMNQTQQLKAELALLADELPGESGTYYAYAEGGTLFLETNRTSLEERNITYAEVEHGDITISEPHVYANGIDIGNETYNNTEISTSRLSPAENANLRFGAGSTGTGARIKIVTYMLDNLVGSYNRTYSSLEEMRNETNSGVEQLDTVKVMIDEELKYTDEYIVKIDSGKKKIEETQKELQDNLDKLSVLHPSIADKLVNPILQSFEPLLKSIDNIKLAFPVLLAQIILFISVLFANIVTLGELNSKAYLRNLISPVNDIVYTLGLIITNMIVVLFQVGVLLLVGQFCFRIDLFSQILPLSLVIVVLSLIFILIGMSFAFLFENEQTSILSVTFVSLAFFLFSDNVIPLELMPGAASAVASMNPFVLSGSIFKKLILFRIPLDYSMVPLSILIGYLMTAFMLLVVISKIKNRKRL